MSPLIPKIAVPVIAVGAAARLAYGTFAAGSTLWGPLVARGPADGMPRITLTFDDGPWPGATDRILDTLAGAGVRATFFVIGSYAQRHPGLVRRMYDEGHLVGNHTYDHGRYGFMRGPWYWREQLRGTDAVIEQIIGSRPRLFRPPLGIKTWFTTRAAAEAHVMVTWTRRAFDGVTTSSMKILDRLIPHARAGEILALHDGVSPQSGRDPSATVDALRPLILGLRGRGLQPVRLDELTGVKAYGTQ